MSIINSNTINIDEIDFRVNEYNNPSNFSSINGYCRFNREVDIYYNLANKYREVRNFNKAIEFYNKALNKIRYSDKIIFDLIVMYVSTLYVSNKFNEALSVSKKYLNKYPNFKQLYLLNTLIFNKMGNEIGQYKNLKKLNSIEEDVKYSNIYMELINRMN
ncbi:tetratricopeptide repeat protein [Clostridium ihumii]|uniref:tetratricopeptide repeat protein n=1 Tax=Clostridium ihumii TaxID=1470356 RepID=UPI00058D803A|nr:tetratricopeptide repeat protein [Clostridium ihumii]